MTQGALLCSIDSMAEECIDLLSPEGVLLKSFGVDREFVDKSFAHISFDKGGNGSKYTNRKYGETASLQTFRHA